VLPGSDDGTPLRRACQPRVAPDHQERRDEMRTRCVRRARCSVPRGFEPAVADASGAGTHEATPHPAVARATPSSDSSGFRPGPRADAERARLMRRGALRRTPRRDTLRRYDRASDKPRTARRVNRRFNARLKTRGRARTRFESRTIRTSLQIADCGLGRQIPEPTMSGICEKFLTSFAWNVQHYFYNQLDYSITD
jgi:hypothetical protein